MNVSNVYQTTQLKAINFGFRDLPEIEQRYPAALEIIRQRVKPERNLVKRETHRERWWRYADARPALAEAVKDLNSVLLQPYTAKYIMPSLYSSRCVFAHPMVVIADSSYARFASLQSTFHTLWVWNYCATSLDLLRYTADRVLATYPFPLTSDKITEVGQSYLILRDKLRIMRSWTLTELYNRLHDSVESDTDILELRELHVRLDQTIAFAYGWQDLYLDHDFYETKQGLRYTISEAARFEVLDRLLELNHQRYAEELADGLHDKKAKKTVAAGRGRKKKSEPPSANEPIQFELF